MYATSVIPARCSPRMVLSMRQAIVFEIRSPPAALAALLAHRGLHRGESNLLGRNERLLLFTMHGLCEKEQLHKNQPFQCYAFRPSLSLLLGDIQGLALTPPLFLLRLPLFPC